MSGYLPCVPLPPPCASYQNSNNLNNPNKSSFKLPNYSCIKSSSSSPATPSCLLPPSADYAIAMDSCNSIKLGRQLHGQTIKRNFLNSREFIEARLLFMYGRCGSYFDACQQFDRMPHKSIYSWVGILAACVDNGFHEKALLIFQRLFLEQAVLSLPFFVFPAVLKACGGARFVQSGKELHGFLRKSGLISNIYVSNALIDMYGKCGAMDEATKVFDGMEERDYVSWNSMIAGCAASGMAFESLIFLERMQSCGEAIPNLVSWSAAIASFAQNGYDEEAIRLLGQMLSAGFKPNAQALASVLPSCGRLEALCTGKQIHGYAVRHNLKSNSFVVNALVDVYSKCGDSISALELFHNSPIRTLLSYNSIIIGYSRNGKSIQGKEFLHQMKLDGLTPDTISYNSLIQGYCDDQNFEGSLKLFSEMRDEGVEADSFTAGGVLTACSALGALSPGKQVHSYTISTGLSSNPFIANSLIEMYSKCHDFMSAELVLSTMIERDPTTWNLLISSHARANRLSRTRVLLRSMRHDGFEPNIFTWNGLMAGCLENERNDLILDALYELQSTGLKPDVYTLGMVITVCTRLVSIRHGKQAHCYAIRHGCDSSVHIGAALVDMYAKCGTIELATLSFWRISSHNLVSFNSLIAGYAMHGRRRDGFALFRGMVEDGVVPDAISFLSVLSLCVHVGSVEHGLHYFDMMEGYGIRHGLKHYTCMVDLFSRAGKLNDALMIIKTMPVEPDAVIWGALLGGCVVHGDVLVGEFAAKRLVELEGDNASTYVVAANLYAIAERKEDSAGTRRNIREMGLLKSPGWSWIEEKGKVHVFLANDSSHTWAHEIYATLRNLTSHLKMDDEMVKFSDVDQ